MHKPLITVKDVVQTFKVGTETIEPLKKVSFDILPNSFNIIYGASGSGKSTLLNVLTGLQKPTSGKVLFEGRDVYSFTPDELARFRAERIGFVYQANYWVKSLNVIDNVAMSLYFLGYSRVRAKSKAMDALVRVNMKDYADKYPVLLSGGEQQRVAMARALVTRPMFIIADEPTGSLDSKNGDMIMDLLRSCQQDTTSTVILVTHNMEYIPLADKLLHIEDGSLNLMRQESIQDTTKALMQAMQQRIDHLSKAKHDATK